MNFFSDLNTHLLKSLWNLIVNPFIQNTTKCTNRMGYLYIYTAENGSYKSIITAWLQYSRSMVTLILSTC